MEIKAQLLKPFTYEQKRDFIIAQNHKLGYIIEETEEALNAMGYTEEEIEEQKKAHIKQLTCTKRVFALMLKELGVSYSKLKETIATNEDAMLEWDLCVDLLRANPLLDSMAAKLDITPEQLDALFLFANGLITEEEFAKFKPVEKEVAEEETTEEPAEEEPKK